MEYMFKTKVKVDSSNEILQEQNEKEERNESDATSDIEESEKIKKSGYITEDQKKSLLTPGRWGTKEMEILEVKLLNGDFKEETNYKYGDKLVAQIRYRANSTIENPVFGFGLFTPDGVRCYGTNTSLDKFKIEKVNKGEDNTVQFIIDNLYLVNGIYYMNYAIHSEDGYIYDYYNRIYSINVYSGSTDIGIFKPKHGWDKSN